VGQLVRTRNGVANRVGLLYGLNTLGAVTGVLVATFVLFPSVGVFRTNLVAAGLDLLIGCLAIAVVGPRFQMPPTVAAAAVPSPDDSRARGTAGWNPALLSYGLVGFTALAYEVCWTRVLSMVLGSSIYAFATMLAAFLTGIALGSLLGRRWFDRLRRPLLAYAFGLAALGVLSLATVLLLGRLPDLFANLIVGFGLSSSGMVATSIVVSMLAMAGPTLVLGALFPLLTRTLAGGTDTPSRTVGDIYFVNTLGSAAGSLLAGFLLIPFFGVQVTLATCMAINLSTAAVIMLWQREWTGSPRLATVALLSAATLAMLAAPPAWDTSGLTEGVYREPAKQLDVGIEPLPMPGVQQDRLLLYRDGINTTVSVHRKLGETHLRVNGKVDAGTGRDMSTQVLLGQVPMLFGGRAERVLAIGLASGVTVGSAALHQPERLDVVELEPAMIEASHYFDDYNHRPLDDPRVHVIADDGRSYLASVTSAYDVIISEPSNPWITGASSLFTREFFRSAHVALRPGGRLLQWVQIYNLDPSDLRAILSALHAEFPVVYGFANDLGSPDLLLLATDAPLRPDQWPDWQQLSEPVRDDLRRINTFSTADLRSLLRLTPDDVATLASGRVNTDDNMLVELHSPWALYADASGDNWQMLKAPHLAVWATLDTSSFDAESIGALALSYATVRQDADSARQLLATAARRGRSADALVAEAELLRGDAATADQAGQRLDEAVAQFPDAFAPRFFRAKQRYAADEMEPALADLTVALQVAPNDLRARYLRLQVLNDLERTPEAQADAAALLASPYLEIDSHLLTEAARTAAAAEHYDEASRLLVRYLEINPYAAMTWSLLGDMYAATGRTDEARNARTNATLAVSNLSLLMHQRARRQLRIGQRVEGIALLRSALMVDPQYEPARADLRALGVGPDPD